MDRKLKLEILTLMLTARCMEERMAKMSKSADAYFWLGGIGEEAFNVPLGMLARKGQGTDYDFFHFHYRNGATMVALGMDPRDELRQIHNRATDPFSGGRNFCNHYAYKPWNVMPVTSTIQTQCSVAPGTALAQKYDGCKGITILTFGDAGTAEGDFHVGLNWATRPSKGMPGKSHLPDGLPMLFICTNNSFGISTPYSEVHGQKNPRDIAEGYGIKTKLVNGNDVEASYLALQEAMTYVREERKPFFLEATVSRLHGHSSSSGANRIPEGHEVDPLQAWRDQLFAEGLLTPADYESMYEQETIKMREYLAEVKKEPAPDGSSIYDHIFAPEV